MQISVEQVGFRYGNKSALKGVNWLITPGVTGLLGPNGAGKTTLLNLLVGLTRPRSGTIRFSDTEGASTIGFVPQKFSLAGELRVIDTVSYAAWVNGTPRRQCAEAAQRALAEVKLTEQTRSKVRTLSGGQRQRVGIAAALAHEPRLVILDEPTAGLDPGQRLRIRELIADVGKRYTVVLSTHLIEDISHVCQRVAVLAAGQLVFDGTVDELTQLVDTTDSTEKLGSDFERAYDALIARLGSSDD
ncbi:ATP-binding cassette domain-containing protein [Amycolatopsis cihanbeyliensis]|uniref:ABC-2 type transport system ATP-binding protein n=1 Tax=Amycolatopsis cihanbeyliensis TaxID=1128664 RepID=A0A542DLM0_AMYCI|nr:ATP-binding cassette domain-containing protein [Amycolatopsis cihanbeyliensis]TQJ03983.1 ABC-2 type transport system ATP-binding protein [Amycolatopsis cihanbeyliensis]